MGELSIFNFQFSTINYQLIKLLNFEFCIIICFL
jgi:hypothetical protein